MKNISRKEFIKKACATGACMCAAGCMGYAHTVFGVHRQESGVPVDKDEMPRQWLSLLLGHIDGIADEAGKRSLLKGCAQAHYDHLKMEELLAPYRNHPDAFVKYLESEWGWKVSNDKKARTILADENKDHCVCPVAARLPQTAPAALCYCSEGFAQAMFSFVLGCAVSATVVSSILRGDQRCVYRIEY
jgi:hypothetical protein